MTTLKINKTKLKQLYSNLVNQAKLNYEFEPDSAEYQYLVSVTRDLPIVYSEMPNPRYCVLNVRGYKGSYRCVHIFKTNKWVPLTAAKVFASSTAKTPLQSKKKRVLAAMRALIKPQIDNFKAEVKLPAECPLTGKIIYNLNGKKAHVDHVYPFSKIVEDWLILNSQSFETIELDRQGDFKDRELARSFYFYHKDKASLALVDAEANLKKGAKC